MYSVKGTLDNGDKISGTIPSVAALATIVAGLPEGRTLAKLTLTAIGTGTVKISAPRAPKAAPAAAPVAAPVASAKRGK